MDHSAARRWFHRLYRRITNEGACVYCGARATTYDHFTPVSVTWALSDILVVRGKITVPACHECNLLASSKLFPTIAAKRRYIHGRLRKRYRRFLAIPYWKQDEVERLDRSLQDFVRSGLSKQQWIKQRLAWRNTSNSSGAILAAIHSGLGAVGNDSVQKPVGSRGTTSND